jgi:hypothetical protein
MSVNNNESNTTNLEVEPPPTSVKNQSHKLTVWKLNPYKNPNRTKFTNNANSEIKPYQMSAKSTSQKT